MNRLVTILVGAILSFFLAANGPERPRLTFEGLGDIRIGMTPEQANALGFRLTSSGPWDEVGDEYFISCHYLDSAPNYPGIALMISDNRVVRIDIGFQDDDDWQSLSGAKIGMSEVAVASIYREWMKIDYHPYAGESGSYLVLKSSNGRYKMIFETGTPNGSGDKFKSGPSDGPNPNKRVTSFRAGLAGPVSYIEGCA